MNFDDGAQFDPGFIQHIQAFVPSIENIYGNLNHFRNFGQKKVHFKMFYPKIQNLLNNYIGFYLGCMLWAVYINKLDNKPILNNLCIGGEYSEEDTLSEVDFIEKYIEQLKKDVKYYLGQNFAVETTTMNIIDAYRSFLKANKGFIEARTTSDIKIPASFKKPSDNDLQIILEKIEDVIETGKLTKLYPLASKIL